jgi:hypothetical protein
VWVLAEPISTQFYRSRHSPATLFSNRFPPYFIHPTTHSRYLATWHGCRYADTLPDLTNQDFQFKMVAGLDGVAGTVSFQSSNYPDGYISADLHAAGEPGRMGLNQHISTAGGKANASFLLVPVPGNSSRFGLVTQNAAYPGHFLGINERLSGSCSSEYPKATKDVVLVAPAAVGDRTATTWQYEVPPPPFTGWGQQVSPGVQATFASDATAPFHGRSSQKISFASGTGVAAITNRGLGNEGLFIEAGKDYEGFFFAKSESPVTLVVQLVHKGTNAVLSSTTITSPGGNWTMLNFTLAATTAVCRLFRTML